MRTIIGAAVAAALCVQARAQSALDVDWSTDRIFGLDIDFKNCTDVKPPPGSDSDANTNYFGDLYIRSTTTNEGTKVDSARGYSGGPTLYLNMAGTVRYLKLGDASVGIRWSTYDYLTGKFSGFGWSSFPLPSTYDKANWESGLLGSENEDSKAHVASIIADEDGSDLGTCYISVRLYAKHCLPGEYIDFETRPGPCETCGAGEYCPNGFSGVACNRGTYATGGLSECLRCPSGTYSDSVGASECQDCPAGTYRNSSETYSCQSCPAGFFGMGASTDPICDGECAAGFMCPEKSSSRTQEPCPAGHWSTAGESECHECDVGYYGTGESTSSTCSGKCSAGYFCPAGSSSPEQESCSKSNPAVYCEEGTTEPQVVDDGYYTIGASESLRSSAAICPKGYKCKAGNIEACPESTYQDEEGQAQCKTCETCALDTFMDSCGAESPGSCETCLITQSNVDDLCTLTSVFLPCDGTGTADTSACFVCSDANSTAVNATVSDGVNGLNETDLFEAYRVNCVKTTLVSLKSGVEPWTIGVSVAAVTLVFAVLLTLIARKRKQMRERMQALDKENKSYANEQDLVVSMQGNINPLFNKRSVAGESSQIDADTASALYQEEIDEINSHRAALESEVRRLKKAQQQDEAAKVLPKPEGRMQPKRKQFNSDQLR